MCMMVAGHLTWGRSSSYCHEPAVRSRWPLHWDFRLFVHKMKWTKGSQGPFYIQLFEFPIHILKLYTQNDLLCFAEEANDRQKVASNHISKNQKDIHILF